MSDMKKAYKEQAKAPKRGVKADDADEYSAPSIDFSDMSVSKGQAYLKQAKAPQGKGLRGHSQNDGKSIEYWDKASPDYKAYNEQCVWEKEATETPSLGFKPVEGHKYLGHFAKDEFLRQGHNDGPNMEMDGVSDGLGIMSGQGSGNSAASQKRKKPDFDDAQKERLQSAQDSMRKAFKY